MTGRNRLSPKRRQLPLASFRTGYEDGRLGRPFRDRRRGALAYESGRLVAAELRAARIRLRPWVRFSAPPPGVMAMVAALRSNAA